MKKPALILFLLFLIITSQSIYSESNKQSQPTIDSTYLYLSNKVTSSAESIDNFFGRFVRTDKENKTRVTLDQNFNFDGDGFSQKRRVNLRLNLPYLEELLKFKVSKKGEIHSRKLHGEDHNKRSLKENVGLSRLKWQFSTGSRIIVSSRPDISFFIDKKLEYSSHDQIYRIINRIFWFGRQGIGNSLFLEYDRQILDNLLFRLGNVATWEEEGEITYSHGPEFYYDLKNKQNISLRLKANAQKQINCFWCITDYNIKLEYGRFIYRDWITLRTGPNINYPKEKNFDAQFSYEVILSLYIGRN